MCSLVTSMEDIPDQTVLRDLNTNVHLVEELHRDSFLLLSKEKHALLGELVVIEEDTPSRLLHGHHSEPFLLLVLEIKHFSHADTKLLWPHLQKFCQLVGVALKDGKPVL